MHIGNYIIVLGKKWVVKRHGPSFICYEHSNLTWNHRINPPHFNNVKDGTNLTINFLYIVRKQIGP